jgi:diaminobutyrate-2-oxoglutarate transaminase
VREETGLRSDAADRLPDDRGSLFRPAFTLLWASETAFDLGSALMTFALGVWIFQRTGSAQQFSGSILAASLPSLLLAPVAGALADRFDRRWVIAACDAASVLMIAGVATLVFWERLGPGSLYLFNAGAAVAGSIRGPAYKAALGAIVPPNRLTQAGGIIGVTQSLLQVFAPLIAGYMMGRTGLEGVVALEMIVALAGGVAAFGALSRARYAIRGVQAARRASILCAIASSFRLALASYRDLPPLAGLAIYGAAQESLLTLATSMMIPLVLSTHSSDAVALILSSGALGGLAGSALLVIAPVERRLMLWVLASNAGISLFVVLAGFASSTLLWCVCAFCALLGGAVSSACASALLVKKTPDATRGSIFALNGALNVFMMCVVMLAGGYLGEHVFEPALATGGAWAHGVGTWVGTGEGRGLGFLFILCGCGGCLLSLLALIPAQFRNFDELMIRVPGEASAEPRPVDPLVI